MAQYVATRPVVVRVLAGVLGLFSGIWSFWKTLLHNKPLGALGFVIVIGVIFTATFAPLIAPDGINDTSRADQFAGPSLKHPFGSDHLGRDLFSRVVWGSRISVAIGFGAVAIAMLISTTLGLLSGYYRGWFDKIVQRFVDGWMTFPGLIIALAMVALVGPGVWQLIIVLGLLFGIRNSRVIRSQVLAVMARPHIEVAQSVGVGDFRLITRHLLPNTLPPIIILATIEIPLVILIEASLSFLGFGVPPPYPAWGQMLTAQARQHMMTAPWIAIAPGVALSMTIFGWNMFGDALRDLLDPTLRGSRSER
jgi:peptide/nickel transport system permease protein